MMDVVCMVLVFNVIPALIAALIVGENRQHHWLEYIDDLESALVTCNPVTIFRDNWGDLPNGGHVKRNQTHSQDLK